MKIQQNGAVPVQSGRSEALQLPGSKINNTQVIEKQGGFNDVLNGKIAESQPLQFSKHASMRLSARAITLSGEQIKRVEDGVSKAGAKGIRDSLVFVDNVALVVNVRSKTVVTAMHTQAGKEQENVFTNIDGAVIV